MNIFLIGLGAVALFGAVYKLAKPGGRIFDLNEVMKYKDFVRKHTAAHLTGKMSGTWVLAILAQESMGNPKAEGDFDTEGKPTAFGLMQLTYLAYKDANVPYSFDSIKRDPERNIETGVKYLAWIFNHLESHSVDPIGMQTYVTMSYNVGVTAFMEKRPKKIEAGKAYVKLIEKRYQQIMNTQSAIT